MSNDRVQDLLDKVTEREKAELVVLHNAVISSMSAYKQSSTSVNLKDWQAAKAALADFVAETWPKYFTDSSIVADDGHGGFKPIYKTRAEAFRMFIQSQALPVSERKFYNDVERLSLLRQDKSVHLEDLMAYVRSELQINPATGMDLVKRDRLGEKEDWEIRKLKVDVETKEMQSRKEDRRWILRDEAEISMAEKILLIYNGVITRVQLDKGKILHAVGAESSRAAELVLAIQASVDLAFNGIASADMFDLVVGGDGFKDDFEG